MKIGVSSNYPYVFVLSLAHILKLSGTVNVITNGLYNNLLFEGTDDDQERDGIFFNSKNVCDYELITNNAEPCDYTIIHFRPIYRELESLAKQTLPENKETVILAAELISSELHYGKKLFLSLTELPQNTKYTETVLDEKDLLLDYYFGMRPEFSLDKCSKNYQAMLLDIYNSIMGTTHTKIKQIKGKEGEING